VAENLFEKLYDAEWRRRNDLIGAASVPLGVLALLGSAVFFLLKEYAAGGGLLDVLFWTGLIFAALVYSAAVYFLVRSYHGYRYQQIPYPSELRSYRQALEHRFAAEGTPLLAGQRFEEFLEEHFGSAAERNMQNNIAREVYLQRTNRATILCLLVVAATAVPFAVRERTRVDTPQRVEITNLRSGMTAQPTTPKTPAATLPPMPVPPPNVDVKLPLQRPGHPR